MMPNNGLHNNTCLCFTLLKFFAYCYGFCPPSLPLTRNLLTQWLLWFETIHIDIDSLIILIVRFSFSLSTTDFISITFSDLLLLPTWFLLLEAHNWVQIEIQIASLELAMQVSIILLICFKIIPTVRPVTYKLPRRTKMGDSLDDCQMHPLANMSVAFNIHKEITSMNAQAQCALQILVLAKDTVHWNSTNNWCENKWEIILFDNWLTFGANL